MTRHLIGSLIVAGMVLAAGAARAADEAPAFELQPSDSGGNLAELKVDGAQVMRITPQWWARDYAWQGVNWRLAAPADDGSVPFTWNVAGLGIAGDGTLVSPAARSLQWNWYLQASKDWPLEGEPGAKQPHGGLTFFLDLSAYARRGCTADPVLKEDRTGFTWEVTPGRTVSVSFSEPLAMLYFEQNQKNQIRCMFYNAPIVPGTLNLSMTVALPEGGKLLKSNAERFAADTSGWFVNALDRDKAFVDLSDLNEKPAGQHGFVEAKGAHLTFSDGTPARLWGMGLSAYTLFPHTGDGKPDRALIDAHARRLAALGCNLVRMTQADSFWVANPNLIAKGPATDKLDPEALDILFYWIKALKDQGIYVWLDMITYRPFREGDNIPGWQDMVNAAPDKNRIMAEGFSYLNPRIAQLWRTTSRELLTRVNPYTGLALKDEPTLAGVMLWNENDLTGHFGNSFLANKPTPYHRTIFLQMLHDFAARTGLEPGPLEQTWLPGASKLLLNDIEYDWNHEAADYLRSIGLRCAISSGHIWGNMSAFSLPALTAGDVTDSHAYSRSQFLGLNPRFAASATDSLAWAHLADHPKIVSEYNMEDSGPQLDAFTIMPYTATIAAFQGWDAVMLYAYSQDALKGQGYSPWNSYIIPQTMGMAPAAALIYRRGDVSHASQTVYIPLSREQAFYQTVDEHTSRAIRTAMETHALLLGLPAVKELPWLKATTAPAGAETVTDLDHDFIPPGGRVVADTGQFRRDWAEGTFVIDTPLTQLAMGLIGGQTVRTADASFAVRVPTAAVALSSLDGRPLKESRRVLLSTSGRMAVDKDRQFLSEPVAGTVTLASAVEGLKLYPLKGDGTAMPAVPLRASGGVYTVGLPTDRGTHWFRLSAD